MTLCHFHCILLICESQASPGQCERGYYTRAWVPGGVVHSEPSLETSFHTPTRGATLAGSPSLCLTLNSFLSTRGSKNGWGAFSSETVCQGTTFLYFLSLQPLGSSSPSWKCGNRIPATSHCTWAQSEVSSQVTQVICPRCGEQTAQSLRILVNRLHPSEPHFLNWCMD